MNIETFANYLGREAANLLGDPPFLNWTFERSVETDLAAPLIDYVFRNDGLDFVCDSQDKVQSIFLYADESRRFKEGLLDLPFASSRDAVLARLGPPSKSGARISCPILGEYGAWDRFACPGYVVHIEYQLNADAIKKITLMRPDIVPG